MAEYKTPLLPPAPEPSPATVNASLLSRMVTVVEPAPPAAPAGEDRSPWSRQPAENEEEFAHFIAYRDQPRPRKLARRANMGTTSELVRMARVHRWFERVEAFDVWQQSVLDYEMAGFLKETARERGARHLAFLNDAMVLVEREFAALRARSEAGNHDGVIRPMDLIRLSEIVVKLRRLEFGEATEITGQTTTVDLSKMSLDELRTMRELAKKLKPDEGAPAPDNKPPVH